MKNILVFSLLLLFTGNKLNAQHTEFGFTTGYSTYSMSDLSGNLEDISKQPPFETKITDNFPGWISFGGFIMEKWNVYGIGLNYQYNSTGARVSSSDFSGRYTFDETLICNAIGLKNNFTLGRSGKFEIGFDLEIGETFSTMQVKETFEIYGVGEMENTVELKSKSTYVVPGLFTAYDLPYLKTGISVGYLMDSKGTLKFDNGQSAELKSDWTGFRIQAFVSIIPWGFKKVKKGKLQTAN